MDGVPRIGYLALEFFVIAAEVLVHGGQPRRHGLEDGVEIKLVPSGVHHDLRRGDARRAVGAPDLFSRLALPGQPAGPDRLETDAFTREALAEQARLPASERG